VSRRVNPQFLGTLLAGVIALCVPALAWGATGGGGMGPGSGSSTGTAGGDGGTSSPTAQPADAAVRASGDGVTIATQESALLTDGLQITGSVSSSDAGQTVEIERWGARTNWSWQPTAQTTVASDGSFAAVWQTDHIGRFALRAVVGGGAMASASSGLPTVTITVYLPTEATLYGPGFYGRRTACGVVLRRSTIGIAHRWLPCGTPVSIYYDGRSMVVPVIDRGPYANGANWDLTMATGRALGMDATAKIGAVSLPPNS
jgi:peptidoglycan lytic transglycosylase